MQVTEAKTQWVPQRRHRSQSEEWKAQRAHEMRLARTAAEKVLWDNLRQEKLGYKFRRQQLLFGSIADFWCAELGLVIEADGSVQDKERGAHRDAELSAYGVTTLRFTNAEIMKDIDRCMVAIITVTERLQEQCNRKKDQSA
jgi:very-short-patch-repair endonuclease